MSAIIPIFIPHEGCPHHCVFCNQGYTRAGAPVTAAGVAEEIAEWLGRFRRDRRDGEKPQIAFYGGTFTALPQARQEELLQAAWPFLESGKASGIRLSTRPDAVDAENLRLLREYGVALVELGVQSCNDAVLAQAGRGHDFAASLQASRLIREAGLQLGWQLLIGLPGERFSGIRKMADFCEQMKPDCARLYPLLVMRGSGLAEAWQSGAFRPISLKKAVLWCSYLKKCLDAAHIPIIRMGLQPGPELAQQFLAGPCHPAFGELVKSRIMLKKARQLLHQHGPGHIHVAPSDISIFTGLKRGNIKRLQRLGFSGFQPVPDPSVPRGHLEWQKDD